VSEQIFFRGHPPSGRLFTAILTLSLLGYLKTRIRWGGGVAPPQNVMFDVQI